MTPTPASNLSDEATVRAVYRQLDTLRAGLNARNYPVNAEDFREYAAVILAAADRARATAEPVAYLVTWPDGDQDLRWEKPESDHSSHYPDGPARIDALSLGATVAPSPVPAYSDASYIKDLEYELNRRSDLEAAGASPEPTTEPLLILALNALVYHRAQTRPIAQTDVVIDALRAALAVGTEIPQKHSADPVASGGTLSDEGGTV